MIFRRRLHQLTVWSGFDRLIPLAFQRLYLILGEQQRRAASRAEPREAFAQSGRAYVRFALNHPNLFRLIFIHTPGHCPGQVCIAVGDVLLSADHVLQRTTPHQSPESITAYTGLGHYLDALTKVGAMGGFDIALGGHELAIHDVYKRIADIRDSHSRKLERMLDSLRASAAS